MRTSLNRERSTEVSARNGAPRTPLEAIEHVVERVHRTPQSSMEQGDPGQAWERQVPDDEAKYGRIRGFQRQGGSLAPSSSHRGRAPSWIMVALAFAGFVTGGLAVVMGGQVVLGVVAAVLLIAAAVVAIAFDILSDVVLDPPRVEDEERHDTPLHRIKKELP
ncbi:hypothetical protein DFP74_0946 [Nocardiopsis sp. Huas11]|uniref:hypothetical protein n=1 Tax=Nocardiopsis sp. Huas11 TaxID=2183912 RepID=UPI000F2B78C5|nr:hypothetical protein [Nocardiopsis sp. Huas11]RKS05351.1 hypothetical protein DFP74_0946 [Nocardiopsis sp. Huas11]